MHVSKLAIIYKRFISHPSLPSFGWVFFFLLSSHSFSSSSSSCSIFHSFLQCDCNSKRIVIVLPFWYKNWGWSSRHSRQRMNTTTLCASISISNFNNYNIFLFHCQSSSKQQMQTFTHPQTHTHTHTLIYSQYLWHTVQMVKLNSLRALFSNFPKFYARLQLNNANVYTPDLSHFHLCSFQVTLHFFSYAFSSSLPIDVRSFDMKRARVKWSGEWKKNIERFRSLSTDSCGEQAIQRRNK